MQNNAKNKSLASTENRRINKEWKQQLPRPWILKFWTKGLRYIKSEHMTCEWHFWSLDLNSLYDCSNKLFPSSKQGIGDNRSLSINDTNTWIYWITFCIFLISSSKVLKKEVLTLSASLMYGFLSWRKVKELWQSH